MAALSRDLRSLILGVKDGEEAAWVEFIDRFAPLLLQATRAVARDRDAVADA